jgi:hypothetical protein
VRDAFSPSRKLNRKDLIKKLDQIEEQARATLDEFPNLVRERQRMIIALTRFVRSEVDQDEYQQPSSNDDLLPSGGGELNAG